jgi:hypothetical protein
MPDGWRWPDDAQACGFEGSGHPARRGSRAHQQGRGGPRPYTLAALSDRPADAVSSPRMSTRPRRSQAGPLMTLGDIEGSAKRMGYSTEKLEALAVERLAREPGMYGDGGGLWLTVRSPTSRSWLFIYVINRISRRMGLGPYPEVTLAMARERAAEARRLVKAHRDPLAERETVRAAEHAEAAKVMTFKQCAEQYICARRKTEHTAQWVTALSTYAFPVIGNIRVASIDTGLVLKVLEPMWASKNETALRLRRVLDWAKLRGYRNDENPARWHGHLDHILPAPTQKQKVGHQTAPPFNFLAAVAEYESKKLSKRIKAALAAAKARGVKLGGNRGVVLTDAARYAGSKALKARANARAADPCPNHRRYTGKWRSQPASHCRGAQCSWHSDRDRYRQMGGGAGRASVGAARLTPQRVHAAALNSLVECDRGACHRLRYPTGGRWP